MKNTYVLTSWDMASKMKSEIHPSRSVRVAALMDDSVLKGYRIQVIEDNEVLYAFVVDGPSEGEYSISQKVAIEILNAVGFNCIYDLDSIPDLSDSAKNSLRGAEALGATLVVRSPHYNSVICYNPSTGFEIDIVGEVVSYRDFLSLAAGVPTLINEIV